MAYDRRMTPPQAARATLARELERLRHAAHVALESDAPEAVHDLRVALRRARSVLRAWRRAWPAGLEARLRPELQWIMRVAGEARDLDVLLATTLPAMVRDGAPVTPALWSRGKARAAAARERLRRALRSARYRRLEHALSLACAGEGREAADRKLAAFARAALERRHRKLRRAGADPDTLDARGRHRLRIQAKRLRYALEGFAPLLPAARVERCRAALVSLQDDLGRAQDAAVARRALRRLAAPDSLQRFARRWLARETAEACRGLEAHLHAVVRAGRSLTRE